MGLVIAGAVGCGSVSSSPGDGGLDGTADTAPTDGPFPFVPIHVLPETLMGGAPDLVLTANPTLIDTTALTIGGATNPYFVRQGDYAILLANGVSVQNEVKVSGAFPLIVVARDRVTVLARIDLNAVGRIPGPGAAANNPGGGGAGQSVLLMERASSGGGGAGYSSFGAPGGTFNAGMIPGGGGGARYGMLVTDPLTGGSRGGSGGFSTGAIGAGGGGGGALQISSAVSVSITSTGRIEASGGGGAGGGGGFVGGGGGGSGGEILLESPSIMIAGRLIANGGGGGGGGAGCGGCSTTGMDGGDGIGFTTPAMGGVGGIPQGSDGGAGAAGGAGAFNDALAGDGFNSKGGGGGGGAGKIWLRHRAATAPDVTGAVVSPPADLDPTLP